LVIQVKNFQTSFKEQERLNVARVEGLQKEIAILKTQISGQKFNKRPNDLLQLDELRNTVSSLTRELELEKDDSRQQILKYEALLADANKTVDQIKKNTPEIAKTLKERLEIDIDKHKEYIVELETKLEWRLENQDLMSRLESKSNSALNDAHHTKQLEDQILDLDIESLNPSKTAKVLRAYRPEISGVQMIKFLKKNIYKLENEKAFLQKEIEELTEKVSLI
jgi:hypothetical protein